MSSHLMRIFAFIFTVSVSLPLMANNPASDISTVPEDFKFSGAPISPLCIERTISQNSNDRMTVVTLANCTREEQNYKIEKIDPSLTEKGFMGFHYVSSDPKNPLSGYIYYKYLGKFNNDHVIYLIQNAGGSGHFSLVFLASRKKDTLRLIKGIVGGDRCNGGIDSVSLKGKKINYTVNITPYDYIAVTKLNPHKYKAYYDLASCAACCQGTAEFESDFITSRLLAVNLGQPADVLKPIQGDQQSCFNTVLNDYISQGKQQLTADELKDFVEKFNTQCPKPDLKVNNNKR